jgi:hypothetical protein
MHSSLVSNEHSGNFQVLTDRYHCFSVPPNFIRERATRALYRTYDWQEVPAIFVKVYWYILEYTTHKSSVFCNLDTRDKVLNPPTLLLKTLAPDVSIQLNMSHPSGPFCAFVSLSAVDL